MPPAHPAPTEIKCRFARANDTCPILNSLFWGANKAPKRILEGFLSYITHEFGPTRPDWNSETVYISQGLIISTPAAWNGLTSRVATLNRLVAAIAAIYPSAAAIAKPLDLAFAMSSA